MNKVTSRDHHSMALLALFDDLTRAGVNVDIYELDEMFQLFYWGQGAHRESAVAMYLASGRAIWETLREVLRWRFGALDRIGRLLDFASGFGRVTRFIVRDLPPDRIWVSDLQADAVAAQAAEFGVHAFVSTEDPSQLTLPGPFDAILVSSLFTHLPPPRFSEWLARLAGALAPGGVLILSVHGAELLDQPLDSIEFRASSESGRLPGESYGSTWVSDAFVKDLVRGVLGESWQVQRFERGLVALQDLYVLTPDQASDPASLQLPRHLDGFVERLDIDAFNRLQVSGWWADRQGRKTGVALSLHLGGQVRALLRADEFSQRTDVQTVLRDTSVPTWGYALETQLERGWDPGASFDLVCQLSDGSKVSLWQGTLLSALLRGSRVATMFTAERALAAENSLRETNERLTSATARVAELAGCVDSMTAAAAAKVEELEGRIRWMEISRFWRLRNRWFAVKRRLGLARPA